MTKPIPADAIPEHCRKPYQRIEYNAHEKRHAFEYAYCGDTNCTYSSIATAQQTYTFSSLPTLSQHAGSFSALSLSISFSVLQKENIISDAFTRPLLIHSALHSMWHRRGKVGKIIPTTGSDSLPLIPLEQVDGRGNVRTVHALAISSSTFEEVLYQLSLASFVFIYAMACVTPAPTASPRPSTSVPYPPHP